MNVLQKLEDAPFTVFHHPNLRLRTPNLNRPGPMTVFLMVLISYFFIGSGILYDMINEPPSIGGGPDGRSVQFFAPRVNSQYIMEGLTAGFLFCIGGIGMIMLEYAATDKHMQEGNRKMLLFASFAAVLIPVWMLSAFIKAKVPGYFLF